MSDDESPVERPTIEASPRERERFDFFELRSSRGNPFRDFPWRDAIKFLVLLIVVYFAAIFACVAFELITGWELMRD